MPEDNDDFLKTVRQRSKQSDDRHVDFFYSLRLPKDRQYSITVPIFHFLQMNINILYYCLTAVG